MLSISAALDPLASSPGRRPSGARLYHRGSVFAEPVRCRMDRAHAWKLMAHAEALDRDTRCPRSHGGCLKDSGLKVLRALLRHFYSYRDGTCFPSYEAIARAAGCCVETVRVAIRRLESAGIISTLRRKVVTSFISRTHRVRFDVAVQTSNSYTFAMPGGGQAANWRVDRQQGARTDLRPIGQMSQPQPRQTAALEAGAKFRHETSESKKSKSSAPIAGLNQPRRVPAEDQDVDIAAEKARWIAALLGDGGAG